MSSVHRYTYHRILSGPTKREVITHVAKLRRKETRDALNITCPTFRVETPDYAKLKSDSFGIELTSVQMDRNMIFFHGLAFTVIDSIIGPACGQPICGYYDYRVKTGYISVDKSSKLEIYLM